MMSPTLTHNMQIVFNSGPYHPKVITSHFCRVFHFYKRQVVDIIICNWSEIICKLLSEGYKLELLNVYRRTDVISIRQDDGPWRQQE